MSISSELEQANPAAEPIGRSSRPSSQALGFTPGSVVAERYRVVSLLGRGGMGEVYRADDLKLGQPVALKFLPREHGHSHSWREQFFAEVRLARQVSHPNVCRVYDVGESDGRLFLSMEFVDGEDLASLLRRIGRLPDDKAVDVAQQLCAGLAAAHRSGVLHRDLKPANVMLDGHGLVRITDFGLAIAAEQADHKASPAGTPGYLAPELLDGAAASVQSDLYALGLVLYELFTGKRAFKASSVAEFLRKQTETNPTPPSSLVKNFDPAVEKAILRCLDHDPAQRPRSALSVAAALPGGDPLAAVLAAGETPSPEMVAGAGPEGSLRPAVAWALLVGTIALLVGYVMFLAPRTMDWGLAPMNKSPEVLADRAEELAQKLGYPAALDRVFRIGSDSDYLEYAHSNRSGTDWKPASAGQVWPSPVSFWYRQSPQWITPTLVVVTSQNPPFETSGEVSLRLDVSGKLRFLRGVPPQLETGGRSGEPDWNLLFAASGLDRTQFAPAPPKWTPPDGFDSRADWEGHIAGQPNLLLHVAAAAYHGLPVYFQVIAPWDKPWRTSPASSKTADKIASAISGFLIVGCLCLGTFMAHRNIRRGRGDARGALRLAAFVAFLNGAWFVSRHHFAPQFEYILRQFLLLGIPLLLALLQWIGYMAVEPFARRSWPKVMVSWQRLLSGRFRDPLVGRDILLGVFTGIAVIAGFTVADLRAGISQTSAVDPAFGEGLLPSIGNCFAVASNVYLVGFYYLGLLSIATRLLRRRWLALAVIALLIVVLPLVGSHSLLDAAEVTCFLLVMLAMLTRVGLVASSAFLLVYMTVGFSPPLDFSRWYAGRAVIALLIPLTLLVYAFYVSLGGQPIFGSALEEE